MKKIIQTVIFLIFVGGIFIELSPLNVNIFLAPSSNLEELNDDSFKKSYLKHYSKDPFNWHIYGAHVERVFEIASIYGNAYGLNEIELKQLKKAAILHDLCLPENFHLTFPCNDFVKQLPKEEQKKVNWYHREGVFSRREYESQMKTTIDIFEKYGIYDFIRKQKGYTYDVKEGAFIKGSVPHIKYKDYSDAELREAILSNLSRINQFSTMTGISYMKNDLGIRLTMLEEALIRFHHTAPMHITLENLKSAFTKKDYFSSLSDSEYHLKMKDFHANVHKMLPVLVLSDTTEASNDGFRVECGFYNRDTETLSFWFSFMKNHLIDKTGELNDKMYNLAFDLVKTRNMKFFQALNKARSTRVKHQNLLPNEQDDLFIDNMDVFSDNLYGAKNISADAKKIKHEALYKLSA